MATAIRVQVVIESDNQLRDHQQLAVSKNIENLGLFESLGDNCEFGFVLRALGNNTSSLLRWGLLDSVADTARGVRTSFRNAFTFEHLEPAGEGQMVRDVTSGVAFHTQMRSIERDGRWEFIAPEAERRKIYEQESRKLDYLRQKFDREIAGNHRIYVTKRNDGLSQSDVEALLNAVRFRGGGRLLYVTLADSSHAAGTVERISDTLVHGWIDRFAPYDHADHVSLTHWQSLLMATQAIFVDKAAPAAAFIAEPPAQLRGLRGKLSGLRRRKAMPAPAEPADEGAELAAKMVAGGFFDAGVYATRFTELFGAFDLGESATVTGWLGAGRAGRIVPTYKFDESFYLASNPDVAATGVFGFEHFLLWGHAEGRAPLPPRAPEDPRHRHFFSPAFYASRANISETDPETLWQHYLLHNMPKDAPPSPLFDPTFYAAQIKSDKLEPRQPGEALMQHWLRVGAEAHIVPTPFFHTRFYHHTHPDLAAIPFGFLHYVLGGIREKRLPCPWFDPYFYAMQPGVPPDAGYDHFLTWGLAQGCLPSRAVEALVQADGDRLDIADFSALLEASAGWDGNEPYFAMPALASLYAAAWHDPAETVMKGFIAYLRAGAMKSPGPLFDPAIYVKRAAEAGIPVPSPHESALLHWVRHGYAARIVPTLRFNEDDYHHMYPDTEQLWGFEHFVCSGATEGRMPRRRAIQRAPAWGKTRLPPLFADWYASDFPDATDGDHKSIPEHYTRRLDELLTSGELAEVFARTQQVDPDVGEIETISTILLPPYHDPLGAVHNEILRRLPAKTYDSVICIPWIRVGGADLVAGLLGRALLRIRPEERVLYLRTDNPHFERANWLPEGADIVDMSDVVQSVTPAVAEHLLRLLLRGVSAKRVFNVNSRLCWMMLRSYGANLALTLHTYSYMFCWDQTPTGLRVGYPAEFFAATANTITGFLTDTAYLRDELSAMYRLPDALRAKVVHLCTPAQTAVRKTAIARTVLERADPASRRLVLWAGRLDRQKRFDLVLEVAKRMPDVEFRCWGAAMLDAPPDLSALPPNVTMQGSFDHFDDLPLEQAGAWLFTALWEGMPTTLIELATRGVAVVGSAVGGVPELIQPDCGWPIPPGADVDEYVNALQQALSDPEEAATRAEALQLHVAQHYNEEVYDAALGALLMSESPI
jgi:glycosyltransferase involved in cell wall biosynthesis